MTDSYRIHYKEEGVINRDISHYQELKDKIILRFKGESPHYCVIDKKRLVRIYGYSNFSDSFKYLNSEEDVKELIRPNDLILRSVGTF